MTLEQLEQVASVFESVVTPVAIIVAGVWAFRKYFLQAEHYPHIETAAEIEFIGTTEDYWIVELRAVLENKGKVEHVISDFKFDLNAIFENDTITTNNKWGGQVDFPHSIVEGSFLPSSFSNFTLGPNVVGKYSFVSRVPKNARFLILHCWFEYKNRDNFHHAMEKTVQVPNHD